MFLWSQKTGVKLSFIQPGKPIQNAFCESFNGTFRDNCLNQYWFINIPEARDVIERWQQHYNKERPHSSLNYTPPSIFAALQANSPVGQKRPYDNHQFPNNGGGLDIGEKSMFSPINDGTSLIGVPAKYHWIVICFLPSHDSNKTSATKN